MNFKALHKYKLVMGGKTDINKVVVGGGGQEEKQQHRTRLLKNFK